MTNRNDDFLAMISDRDRELSRIESAKIDASRPRFNFHSASRISSTREYHFANRL